MTLGTCPATPGEICCVNNGAKTGACVATGPCPSGTTSEIDCKGPGECPMGNSCCGTPTGSATIAPVPGCTYDKSSGEINMKCASSCAAGDYVICEANGDCPSGQTCIPFKFKGAPMGHCM
jgi:hypothetical protein